MAKFTAVLLASLASSSSAFVSQQAATSLASTTALQAKEGVWDPLGLYTLGSGEAFDTFPNCFPNEQYLEASEVKHGRQAMLAWTGIWATTQVRACVGHEVFRCWRYCEKKKSWLRHALRLGTARFGGDNTGARADAFALCEAVPPMENKP